MTGVNTYDFIAHFRSFLRVTNIPYEHHAEIGRYLQLFMDSNEYEAAYCEHRRREKLVVSEIHASVNSLRRRSRNAKLPNV